MKTEQLLKEATARPWKGFDDSVATILESDSTDLQIGDIWDSANAALIVRAVNSFEAMREALKDLLEEFDGGGAGSHWENARKALAIAEGKETK